jgi:RHH-type proline utilization regulon transcriptional repressor/proline dehydrogenase/delta 1-pyrroline-5-carboxylate dehydrogenase
VPIRRAVVGQFVHIADEPVLPLGRIELLWYVQEQSISVDYHRYGNLGSRSNQPRRPTT